MLGFNYKKSVQALNFFTLKVGGSINKMKSLKLIWLSDRLHLRNYGRPILNDIYFALNYGPIASSTKDLVEDTIFLTKEEKIYRNLFISNQDHYFYGSKKSFDSAVFSKTDIEVMEIIFAEFGHLDEFDLSKESHKYLEWRRFEEHLKSSDSSRYEMNYEDFFSSFSKGENIIFEKDDFFLELSRDMFLENGYIYRLI